MRLAFALGSWQLVALDAGLRAADAACGAEPADETLVLYETGPASAGLVAAMHDVAMAVRPWRKVVDCLAWMPLVHRKISQREFETLRERLLREVGVERVDELWLCRVTRAAERLVMEAWPDAKVVLYEDGVLSYLPMREPAGDGGGGGRVLARWRIALDARRPVLRLRRWKNALDPRHRARIEEAWMLLGDTFAAPRALKGVTWHAVGPAVLEQTVAACQTIPAVARFAPLACDEAARPRVLVLGQALSRYNALPRVDEEAVYARAVRQIVALGYDVWWKEHPRATEPFFAAVAAGHPQGRVRELTLPFALPVELVAGRLGLAACVGGITTALFYLPRLFRVAAYSFSDAFAGRLRGDWALQNELFMSRIAPLGSLPAARDLPSR